MTSNRAQPTVFVVNNDEAAREALSLVLKSAALNASMFASAGEFLAKYDPERPGCLVVDAGIAGMSGLALQEYLGRCGNTIPILFITRGYDIPLAVRAMKQGAFDFLQEPLDPQRLIERIRQALTKDQLHRAQLRQHALIRERLDSMSLSEREVLQCVATGKSNKLIARQLGVNVRMVETHRASVMEKLGARSLAELVRMVLTLGG